MCYTVKVSKEWLHFGGQIMKQSKNFMRFFIMVEDFQLQQKQKIILTRFRPDSKPNPSKYSWDWKFSIQKVSGMVRNFIFIVVMIAFFTVDMYHNLPWHLSHAVNHRHMFHITSAATICLHSQSFSGLSMDLCHTMHITVSGFVFFIFLVLSLLTHLLEFSKVCN